MCADCHPVTFKGKIFCSECDLKSDEYFEALRQKTKLVFWPDSFAYRFIIITILLVSFSLSLFLLFKGLLGMAAGILIAVCGFCLWGFYGNSIRFHKGYIWGPHGDGKWYPNSRYWGRTGIKQSSCDIYYDDNFMLVRQSSEFLDGIVISHWLFDETTLNRIDQELKRDV